MSLIITGGTTTLLNFINKDVILKTINKTCSSILILLNYFINNDDNIIEIKNKLTELDLQNKINIITLMIEENIDKYNKKSINLSFLYIKESLELLNNELNELKDNIESHNKSYISYIKKFNSSTYIDNIINNNYILDNRLELLLKIIVI